MYPAANLSNLLVTLDIERTASFNTGCFFLALDRVP
jgi:hypothetical protein